MTRIGMTLLAAAALLAAPSSSASTTNDAAGPPPVVSQAVAFDVTPPLGEMPVIPPQGGQELDIPELGPLPQLDSGYALDGALEEEAGAATMPSPLFTFEGIRNLQNVAPPDPVGDVGIHHYVEMVNLSFAVYSKQGQLLFGPAALGTLWQGFPVADCAGNSGDPIVIYDEISNRWLLSQFTSQGPVYYNCVALSVTQDPLGPYYRWAFSTGRNFPDYPKYGLWPDAYYITTREFLNGSTYVGVGIYAVDRKQMLEGNPTPRQVSFFLDRTPPYLPGDGLLPADFDGKRMPPPHSPETLVGSMDAGGPYGAPFDGLNVFQARVNWENPELSTFGLVKQLPIAPFDTVFPCLPTNARACIPQPLTTTTNMLDILSYRQRPTWRLAYRNFGTHEALVTNQSVEARPALAGVRWWELRNPSDPLLHQEGTWAPDDGVHRWMGSAALDEQGNIALGYSVSNAIDVFPGIRYAGRLAGDPPGTLAQGEAVLIDGTGAQTGTQRWGDYTSLNVDPRDGCTFWYVNEYFQTTSSRGWQTRIGTFRFPGCD